MLPALADLLLFISLFSDIFRNANLIASWSLILGKLNWVGRSLMKSAVGIKDVSAGSKTSCQCYSGCCTHTRKKKKKESSYF